MSKQTFHFAEIDERNGEFEYSTPVLFKTYGNPDRKHLNIAKNWRGSSQPFDHSMGGFWSDHTLISTGSIREITKEQFSVLSDFFAVL